MEITQVKTEVVNKWWDNLPHETKLNYISRMNGFNWGYVYSVSSISKYQKNELYQQVHKINGKNLVD